VHLEDGLDGAARRTPRGLAVDASRGARSRAALPRRLALGGRLAAAAPAHGGGGGEELDLRTMHTAPSIVGSLSYTSLSLPLSLSPLLSLGRGVSHMQRLGAPCCRDVIVVEEVVALGLLCRRSCAADRHHLRRRAAQRLVESSKSCTLRGRSQNTTLRRNQV
jgi:hypothetical protein